MRLVAQDKRKLFVDVQKFAHLTHIWNVKDLIL